MWPKIHQQWKSKSRPHLSLLWSNLSLLWLKISLLLPKKFVADLARYVPILPNVSLLWPNISLRPNILLLWPDMPLLLQNMSLLWSYYKITKQPKKNSYSMLDSAIHVFASSPVLWISCTVLRFPLYHLQNPKALMKISVYNNNGSPLCKTSLL